MRRWRLVAVLIGIIGMVSWGFAQETTPEVTSEATEEATEELPTETPFPTATSRFATPTLTPTPQVEGFITFAESEIIFPQAIRFFVRLDAPLADLESVVLTLQWEGTSPQRIEADFETDVLVSQPDTDIEILWAIPADEPPPLFTDIEYSWEAQLNTGETAQYIDRLTFLDERATWTRVEDPYLTIAMPLRNLEALPLAALLNPVYDLLIANTDREPRYRLLVYDELTPPGCDLDEETEQPIAVGQRSGLTIPCEIEQAEAIYEASDYTLLRKPVGLSFEAFLTDYMMRDFYRPLWQGQRVPAWFIAGLSQFYTPSRGADLLTPAQLAARGTGVFNLINMNTQPTDSNALALWRAQSYGMVLYIAELVGLQGVYDLASAVGESDSFEEAYEDIVGQPLSALIPGWSGWLFSQEAVRAYALNPYGPSTPLPSLTPTLTPSRTPTPTETLTPTVTPSVTGFLSPTPAPTLTPSVTFTPVPPTVTPRRPGSLPTITPTPSPTLTDTLTQPGVQGGVLIALLIALVALVFVFIRLGRR
jgi:hypothetical protein